MECPIAIEESGVQIKPFAYVGISGQQLKGVELRNLCCFNIPHLRGELRNAVKRVRRKPRLVNHFKAPDFSSL